MGEVVQIPTGPRPPYFLLAWDQFTNQCRLDFVHTNGGREHLHSRKDYLSLRDAARQYADQAGLRLVDQLDPTVWMRRR